MLDLVDRQLKCGGIEAFAPAFDRLDVLVLAQGAVIYRRGEFEMAGFRKVLEVNLISLMACAAKFQPMLRASRGSLIIVSSTAAYHATKGNPAYNASKTGAVGLTRTLAQAWALTGRKTFFEAAREHLESWLLACPYRYGPNWASSLEVALRLVNWSAAWQLLGGAHGKPLGEDPEFRQRWPNSIARLTCSQTTRKHVSIALGFIADRENGKNLLLKRSWPRSSSTSTRSAGSSSST